MVAESAEVARQAACDCPVVRPLSRVSVVLDSVMAKLLVPVDSAAHAAVAEFFVHHAEPRDSVEPLVAMAPVVVVAAHLEAAEVSAPLNPNSMARPRWL